jgi:chromosome segregation ATPase
MAQLKRTAYHTKKSKTTAHRRYYKAKDDIVEVTSSRDLLQENIDLLQEEMDTLEETSASDKEALVNEILETRKAGASRASFRIACNKADDLIDDLETELDKAKDCNYRLREEVRVKGMRVMEAKMRETLSKREKMKWQADALKCAGALDTLVQVRKLCFT